MIIKLYNKKNCKLIGAIIISFFITACSSEFLEVKPDKALLIPSSLDDYEALINNEVVHIRNTPSLTILGTDNVYLTNDMLTGIGLEEIEKNVYLWEKDLFEDTKHIPEWKRPYESVFYSNVVIEGLNKIKITEENSSKWNTVYGTALFYRALGHFNLVRIFADVYDSDAESKLGIPLKLTASISDLSGRANLKMVYDQVLSDLLLSLEYVPNVSLRKSLPDKNSVNALLARVYILINEYDRAYHYADGVLQQNSTLLDYNKLDLFAAKPIPIPYPTNENPEVVFFSEMAGWLFRSIAYVSPELYGLYSDNDLRKYVFFAEKDNGYYSFIGTYNRTTSLFDGITTAELYLIRAECAARKQEYSQAKRDLEMIWQHRYRENTTPDLNRISDETILNEFLN